MAARDHPILCNIYDFFRPVTDDMIERQVAILDLVQTYDNGPLFERSAGILEEDVAGLVNAAAATAALRQLRERNLPSRRQPDRMIGRCLSELAAPPEDTPSFGSVSRYPEYLWTSLRALRHDLGDGEWKRAFEILQARIPAAKGDEMEEMARILLLPAVHEHVGTDFLRVTAVNHPGLREACLRALAQRDLHHDLLLVANQLDLPGQLRVLRYHCAPSHTCPGFLRQSFQDPFWKHCLAEDLLGTLGVMREVAGTSKQAFFEPWLSLEIRAQIKNLVELHRQEPWPDKASQSTFEFLIEAEGRHTRQPGHTLRLIRSLKESRPDGESDAAHARRVFIANLAEARMLSLGWLPEVP